ncbi:hypothetical protein OZN62_02215 [Aurantiacibacter sp. MUD11]|uniref:squalene/phytoene synthase family protein n=1 Tax=Aurantiacibacter sp. MUD11 TaxID=3003265 RepID=UPI0022A9FC8D|nr:squalene/phytoene synthase family protein [Aurantiacibacter sp. MUD11]WAT18416.1 hypothetical protein OZN62_02215 [Aurantiacibacter sp. MUD11]
MTDELIETLPLAQRLALSYAPRESRSATLSLLALDARLAGIVRGGGEAVIAQMKLAWWRERLVQRPRDWPEGEPLLAAMRDSLPEPLGLVSLVDGWEQLLADSLDEAAINEFATGRTVAWQLVGRGPAVVQAAREWALVDLALNLGQQAEREAVLAVASAEPWERASLPRDMRTLAVLHGLARRALRKGSDELLDGPGAMATAFRLGIAGR